MGRNSGTGGRGRRPGAAGIRRGVGGGVAQLGAPAGPVAEVLPPRVEVPQAPRAALLSESRVRNRGEVRYYDFRTASGNNVQMTISNEDGYIVFTVNDSVLRGRGMSQDERNAVSLRLLQHIRQDARTRPDGFKYYASAASGDGYSQQRALAYETIGMSRPTGGEAGRSQYGIVQGGRVRPDLARLQDQEGSAYAANNQYWNNTRAHVQQMRVLRNR